MHIMDIWGNINIFNTIAVIRTNHLRISDILNSNIPIVDPLYTISSFVERALHGVLYWMLPKTVSLRFRTLLHIHEANV